MTDLIQADVTGGDMFLVTGGTGTLGRLVVPQLLRAGGKVRVLSRRDHESAGGAEYAVGDLDTGAGIDAAVAGADVIVHCAGAQKGDGDRARTLVGAASRAEGSAAPHLVNISVTGADRVPQDGLLDRAMFGYFGSKLDAEQVIAASGLPWTTLRATQFYDLLLMMARAMARLPVVPVASGMRFQPVDAGEVAARVAELALGPPSGLVPDLAGPRVYPMADLVRGYLRVAGQRRPVVPVRLPGRAAQAVRDGANLAPERAVGRRTWEEFLAERVGR
jgi:uncharacterized protein YbjT (DUF2867 family)